MDVNGGVGAEKPPPTMGAEKPPPTVGPAIPRLLGKLKPPVNWELHTHEHNTRTQHTNTRRSAARCAMFRASARHRLPTQQCAKLYASSY